ncbi:MAG: diguanylate cyclase [Fuerstiella sp.]
MNFQELKLVRGRSVDGDDCRIRSHDTMLEMFRRTADSAHSHLFVEDESGRPVGVIGPEDVLKRITDPSPYAFARWMEMPVEAGLAGRFEVSGAGERLHQDTTITEVTRDGRLLGLMTETDVLISWRSIQQILKSSQGDSVTGLPNRTTFDYHLKVECDRGRRCGHSVAVILVDLDYFKQINDEFGHPAGDAALNVVGSTLRKLLRSWDLVARFGGDEFGVICSGCRPGEIDIVLRRIREVVLELHHNPAMPRPLPTVSVGAAVIHDLDAIRHTDDIIQIADECLYAAKGAGRNCAWKSELTNEEYSELVFVEDRFSHVTVPGGSRPEASLPQG